MGHHHHHHGHSHDGKLNLAVLINILLTVVQIIGGILSGSLSLIADALHNLSDAGAIVIAIVARKVARKPATNKMTYGFKRAEILGALVNSTTLIIVGLYLIYEAISTYFNPEPINGWIVVWIATLALAIDATTAWLTYKSGAKDNLNLKAAFIHNLSDAFASVVVIVAGTLIILYQWVVVDLIATIGISIYVIYHGLSLAQQSINILMQAAPETVDVDDVCEQIESLTHVAKVQHIHVWQLDDNTVFLEASLSLVDAHTEHNLQQVKQLLAMKYNIHHSTIEVVFDQTLSETNCYQVQ